MLWLVDKSVLSLFESLQFPCMELTIKHFAGSDETAPTTIRRPGTISITQRAAKMSAITAAVAAVKTAVWNGNPFWNEFYRVSWRTRWNGDWPNSISIGSSWPAKTRGAREPSISLARPAHLFSPLMKTSAPLRVDLFSGLKMSRFVYF